MAAVKLRFISKEHEEFYNQMLEKSGGNDSCCRSFLYCMGLSDITRKNICMLYNFEKGHAESGGLHGIWQTGSTKWLTCFALNLWNGYTEPGEEGMPALCDIFDSEYAPYLYEAIKLRYPEYCWDLSANRNESIRKESEQ